MKTNELMIGDWVNFGGDLPRYSKVTELRTHDIQVCNYWIDKECITPIPLTPEILEKNGFLHGDFGWQNDGIDFLITISFGRGVGITTFCGNASVWVEYVHELQHALRLCGLNDLADNFKI